MEITSVNNEVVKDTVKLQQRKYRDRENKFLLEGFKSIEEAFNAGLEIEHVFVLKEKVSEYSFFKDKIISVSEAVLKKISTTESSPDAVGVARKKTYDKNILNSAKKVVLLESIKDLGNLGTILRTAASFEVDAIVTFKDSTDIYNPKCVRASVGNLWKVPVFEIKDLEELKIIFKDFEKTATLPKADNSVYLREYRPQPQVLVMFGSEADGLSQDLKDIATSKVTIEMSKDVESLNLSISCAIILYELYQSR